MSTPSPGPWRWVPGPGWPLVDAHGKRVIVPNGFVPKEPDATLIAAAPELAAMVKELQLTLWDLRKDMTFADDTGRSIDKTLAGAKELLARVGR